MKTLKKILLSLILVSGQVSFVLAESEDAFQIFEREAKVVSASHQPQRLDQASATVYVVTSEEIKDSGATTVWDALRMVPGLDVMTNRTSEGNVSVRGMNQPFNSRTLVMIDGRTAWMAFNNFPLLEDWPISLDEIDRIEVVEGPASAVYGSNAINGVINVITKTPKQLDGGLISYTAGQRQTHIASTAYGREVGKHKYKMGAGWNQTNSLEDDNRRSLRAWKWNGLYGYRPTNDSELNVSGGLNSRQGDFSAGAAGLSNDNGVTFFSRIDYRYKDTKFLTYWNGNRDTVDVSGVAPHLNFDSDRYYTNLEQAIHLPYRNDVVVGMEYSHLYSDVTIYDSGERVRDLWAGYLEDLWGITDKLSLMVNGRVDTYPLTSPMYSTLGSLIYTPITDHTFRVAAGQSFRYPNPGENNLDTHVVTDNPDPGTNPIFPNIDVNLLGSRDLDPEKMVMEELAYRGRFGSFKTGLTGFHYVIKDVIAAAPFMVTSLVPPTLGGQQVFQNLGEVEAWGGEATFDYLINSHLTTFANYSMQNLEGDTSTAQQLANQAPRHKVGSGVRLKHSGWTGYIGMNWVDKTRWDNYNPVDPFVNAYFLVDTHVGYAFKGRWDGLEVGVSGFNIANHKHYEYSKPIDSAPANQRGEQIGNRWTGNVRYRF